MAAGQPPELRARRGAALLVSIDAWASLDAPPALPVSVGGRPLRNITDLQFVRGEIWANVWREDKLACIDPTSGDVRAFALCALLASHPVLQFQVARRPGVVVGRRVVRLSIVFVVCPWVRCFERGDRLSLARPYV